MQDLTFQAAMALRDSLMKDGRMVLAREDALAIKALTSAWESAQQRVAFHRHMPSPGVLKRQPEPKSKRRPACEPISPDLPKRHAQVSAPA